MEQQKAQRMLREARERIQIARNELDAAIMAMGEAKVQIANGLGPFKVGDRLQRKGDKKIYQITTANVFSAGWGEDAELFAQFKAFPLKPDGTPSTRGEHYVTMLQADKWQVVSLPQE